MIINILLILTIIIVLYFYFFKKRVIVSEDMTNVHINSHNQGDYNV